MAQRKNQEGRSGTSNRGFASMDAEQQRAIARKGGVAVSENRAHMAEIGRKGGEASGINRRRNQQNNLNNPNNPNNPNVAREGTLSREGEVSRENTERVENTSSEMTSPERPENG